jgi:DNA-binding MarR family transcriptional regulator
MEREPALAPFFRPVTLIRLRNVPSAPLAMVEREERAKQHRGETMPGLSVNGAGELKPGEALSLWHDVVVQSVRREGPDLSSRQMAIMFIVYLDPPPQTVRGLAASLGVSKPAITRALDTLGGLDLLKRMRDEADRRNVLVQRTVKGAAYMREFADLIVASSRSIEA